MCNPYRGCTFAQTLKPALFAKTAGFEKSRMRAKTWALLALATCSAGCGGWQGALPQRVGNLLLWVRDEPIPERIVLSKNMFTTIGGAFTGIWLNAATGTHRTEISVGETPLPDGGAWVGVWQETTVLVDDYRLNVGLRGLQPGVATVWYPQECGYLGVAFIPRQLFQKVENEGTVIVPDDMPSGTMMTVRIALKLRFAYFDELGYWQAGEFAREKVARIEKGF
jgi:hypothetical protein